MRHHPIQVRRFVGCGAPRGTAESKARFGGIWIRVAGSAPVGGKILPVPSPVAGPRGGQRAGPGAGAVAAVVHGLSGPGGRWIVFSTWEPSTSSGSWNARPPNRLRLAGLACLRGGQMITPRWTLSAAIAIPPSCGGSSPRCAPAPVVLRAEARPGRRRLGRAARARSACAQGSVLGWPSAPTASWRPVCGFAVGRVLVHVMSERTADAGWIACDRTRPMRQMRAVTPNAGDKPACRTNLHVSRVAR